MLCSVCFLSFLLEERFVACIFVTKACNFWTCIKIASKRNICYILIMSNFLSLLPKSFQ